MFVMKPSVFDAIDLVSVAHDGLRRGTMFDGPLDEKAGCMVGAALFAGAIADPLDDAYDAGASAEDAGILPCFSEFDEAHTELAPNNSSKRLPWTQIAAQMGVVRGTED